MTLFRILGIMEGRGDAVKEICVGGCIRPSKVCGRCNGQRAGSTGWCWGGGSTGLDMQRCQIVDIE